MPQRGPGGDVGKAEQRGHALRPQQAPDAQECRGQHLILLQDWEEQLPGGRVRLRLPPALGLLLRPEYVHHGPHAPPRHPGARQNRPPGHQQLPDATDELPAQPAAGCAGRARSGTRSSHSTKITSTRPSATRSGAMAPRPRRSSRPCRSSGCRSSRPSTSSTADKARIAQGLAKLCPRCVKLVEAIRARGGGQPDPCGQLPHGSRPGSAPTTPCFGPGDTCVPTWGLLEVLLPMMEAYPARRAPTMREKLKLESRTISGNLEKTAHPALDAWEMIGVFSAPMSARTTTNWPETT